MCFDFKNLSDSWKGNLLILFGLVLLFHTLGVLTQYLGAILIIISIAMIIIGSMKAGYYKKLMKMMKKKNKPLE